MIRICGKIIPWAKIRSWIWQALGRRRTGDLVDALSRIEGEPDRIDAVAHDLNSDAKVYADVGAWALGELLGLDWEDAPFEWSYTSLAARLSLNDAGFDRPFAENLQLLRGLIPDDRYAALQELIEVPQTGEPGRDLPLTDEELELLEKRYAEAKAPDAFSLGLARTELVASDGTVLHFEVVIGDAGELEDPKGPYEYERGEFLDTSEWIEID